MRWDRLIVTAALVVAACSGETPVSPSPSPSAAPTDSAAPSPTLAPSPSPSASASLSPSPSPTSSPTATLTLPPPPSPTTPPTPTPAPTADPNGWTELTGFPTYGRRTEVTGIAYGGGRFVAVGWSIRNGNTRGRVWTSSDGLSWQAQPATAFAGLTLEAVTHNGTDFYAFASPSTSLWRSRDGSSWEEVDLPLVVEGEIGSWDAFTGSYVSDAMAIGGTMYVAGETTAIGGDIDCSCVTVWQSDNGVDWNSSTAYEDDVFMAFAATPNVVLVIAYGNYIGQGLRYTTNLAASEWSEPDVDLREGSGFLDVAADGQRIVAVGYTGDEFDDYDVALAMVTDGSTWTVNTIDATSGVPADLVTSIAGRFVAVGGEVSWSSLDGVSWLVGPSLPNVPSHSPPPEGGDDPFLHRTIGSGGPGIVLADTGDDGLHVWFAPPSAFE
jgi:hypothetical protein